MAVDQIQVAKHCHTVALEVAPRERSLARVRSSHTRVRYSIARVSSSYARVLYSIARVPSSDTRVPHSVLHCECPQLLPRTCGGCGARCFVPRPTNKGARNGHSSSKHVQLAAAGSWSESRGEIEVRIRESVVVR